MAKDQRATSVPDQSSKAYPRPTSPHGNAWLAASVLSVLLVMSVVGLSLWQQRADAWRSAERTAENLLTILSLEISNRFALVDIVLREAVDTVADTSVPMDAKRRRLARAEAAERYIGAVLILDAEGEIILDSQRPQRTANFADRDYFVVHKEQSDHGLFVSRPYRSRLRGGDPSIGLSRRLFKRGGGFSGVALVAFRLAYFRELLSSVDVGDGGVLAVSRSDGLLLARHPPLPGDRDIGMDVSGSTNFRRILADRAGAFTATATIDGADRLYTFRPIDGTDLFLSVGLSVDAILAEWNRRAVVIGSATLFVSALLIGQALLLRRELGRRASAEADLAVLSMTDSLTGLPNRRRFDEFLNREWRRASRTGAPLSMLLIDADRFKELNDRFGHVRGDEVLRQLSTTIAESIRRPGDLAARFGGEEFAVVMPDTEAAGARRVAETIRDRVSRLGVSDGSTLTVSIGVASARPSPESHVEGFIAQADAALYAAKGAGRDRVHEAAGDPPSSDPSSGVVGA